MERDVSLALTASHKAQSTGAVFMRLLDFTVIFHSDDSVSLFVYFVHIPVRLDDLFERLDPVIDRV